MDSFTTKFAFFSLIFFFDSFFFLCYFKKSRYFICFKSIHLHIKFKPNNVHISLNKLIQSNEWLSMQKHLGRGRIFKQIYYHFPALNFFQHFFFVPKNKTSFILWWPKCSIVLSKFNLLALATLPQIQIRLQVWSILRVPNLNITINSTMKSN